MEKYKDADKCTKDSVLSQIKGLIFEEDLLEYFENMNQSENDIKELFEYSHCPKGFVLLAGSNGSGKSYAATAIYYMNTSCRLPHHEDEGAIFISQSELNFKYLNCVSDHSYDLSPYQRTKLLVIDDLGTRIPSSGFMDFLYAIIDYRWNQGNSIGTVITTNLNASTMRETFGDAFVSRMTSGIVKRWDHSDRRFQKSKEKI